MQTKKTTNLEQSDTDIDELVSWLEMMGSNELDLASPLGEKNRRHRLNSTAYITLHGEIEPRIRDDDYRDTKGDCDKNTRKKIGENIDGGKGGHTRRDGGENIGEHLGKHTRGHIGGDIGKNIHKKTRLNDNKKRTFESNIDSVDEFDETSTWAYAELVRLGSKIEFAGVIIDPNRRGRGHSHHLVKQAIERWRQDAILHRANPPITGETRLGLFCFTRHIGLATALLNAGFVQQPAIRHWSRLWLRRSSVAPLPFSTQFSLISNRFLRTVKTLFSDPKRVIHQVKHLSNYQLYIFNDSNSLE